jgi:hypothetical protein
MAVGRITNENVTTERAISFREEIVIHFGPALSLEIETETMAKNGEFKSWCAVRVGQGSAGASAQSRDPDTRPCVMADVLSFAKVLAKVIRTTSVSGVRTAQCVAELLLNAQGFYGTRLSR